MATRLRATRVSTVGDKIIEELVGVPSTGHDGFSLARMTAPPGWRHVGQRPDFDEVSFVLAGELVLDGEEGEPIVARAGESVLVRAGEWVRYSAGDSGADYLSFCSPAFTVDLAHRDEV